MLPLSLGISNRRKFLTAIPNLDRSGGARQVGRVLVLLRE
jgi:hypothetical protein